MKRTILFGMMLLTGVWTAPVMAANSVSIYWWSIWECQIEQRLGITIVNDVPLKSLTVPLIVRGYGSLGLHDMESVKLSFDQRLAGNALSDVRESNLYFTEDGVCKSGQPGGFGTADFSDTLTHTAPGTTFGLLFHAATLSGNYLPAGTDSLDLSDPYYSDGSLYLTMEFTIPRGLWTIVDIDTTCADPAHHLLFVDASDQAIVPEFTAGMGYIDYFCSYHGDLDGDYWYTALDLGIEIDYLFAGGSIDPHTGCEGITDPGDINCDGYPDATDLAAYIDLLFAGGAEPCDPMRECAPCLCGKQP